VFRDRFSVPAREKTNQIFSPDPGLYEGPVILLNRNCSRLLIFGVFLLLAALGGILFLITDKRARGESWPGINGTETPIRVDYSPWEASEPVSVDNGFLSAIREESSGILEDGHIPVIQHAEQQYFLRPQEESPTPD